ncbi:MAG: hypothetical protein NXI10_10425 [bacterium]|nr:hypothetical protein [bacterium]
MKPQKHYIREAARFLAAEPLATMKTTVTILILTITILIGGCADSDFVATRVNDYPEQLKSNVIEELHAQYNNDITVLTMDVFHPVITQLEPTRKKYIDSAQYSIFVQLKNASKTEFCAIQMDSRFKIFEFRKEKSWPVDVPEKRQRMR